VFSPTLLPSDRLALYSLSHDTPPALESAEEASHSLSAMGQKKFTHQKKAVKKAGIQKRHTFKSTQQLAKDKHVSTLASTSAGLDFSEELDVRCLFCMSCPG
jgi:hypothetical protein